MIQWLLYEFSQILKLHVHIQCMKKVIVQDLHVKYSLSKFLLPVLWKFGIIRMSYVLNSEINKLVIQLLSTYTMYM